MGGGGGGCSPPTAQSLAMRGAGRREGEAGTEILPLTEHWVGCHHSDSNPECHSSCRENSSNGQQREVQKYPPLYHCKEVRWRQHGELEDSN